MAFRVGQKVVCVDASGARELTKGGIYTFIRCCTDDRHLGGGCDGVLVAEAAPIPVARGKAPYCSFVPTRFRPLVERKSSTGTGFTILDDIRKRETVEDIAPVKPARVS